MELKRLSRRERQIMDILYRDEKATVQEVLAALSDPPSYSAVRALLRIMEEKGYITHHEDGVRFVYAPVHPRHNAAQNALQQLVQTFFGGSAANAALTLLSQSETRLSDAEIARLSRLIETAQQQSDAEADDVH